MDCKIGDRIFLKMPGGAQNGMPGTILDIQRYSCGNLYYKVKWDNGAELLVPSGWTKINQEDCYEKPI